MPADAVDYLLDQQCSDGSFRLYQFGYVLSFDPLSRRWTPTPATTRPRATPTPRRSRCRPSSSRRRRRRSTARSAGAVDFLLDQQQASGGFFGTGAVNSNTTGLAAAALRAGG